MYLSSFQVQGRAGRRDRISGWEGSWKQAEFLGKGGFCGQRLRVLSEGDSKS